jgi:hypothetical protein
MTPNGRPNTTVSGPGPESAWGHLEAVLDDLRHGLRIRAVRRRRARAAATGSVTLVLMLAALAGGAGLNSGGPAYASVGSGNAARVLQGCDVLNLPKPPHEAQQACVVP